jgi:hypothetical protein
LATAVEQSKDLSAFLTALDRLLADDAFVGVFCKSPLFGALQKCLVGDATNRLLSILKCCAKVPDAEIDLSRAAETIDVDEEVCLAIREIMSGGLEFGGIMNKSSVPLILPVLRSKFAIDLLKELANIVTIDAVKGSVLFEFSVVDQLLFFLKSFPSEARLFEMVLVLTNRVLSFACNRQCLETFFELFRENFGFCRFRLLFRYLQSMMMDDPLSRERVLRFDSACSVVTLPILTSQTFFSGFTFTFNLCLPKFTHGFCLLSISHGAGCLVVVLNPKSVEVRSSMFVWASVSVPFVVPENSWFNVMIAFVSLGDFCIFRDGVLVGEGHPKYQQCQSRAHKVRNPGSGWI